MKYKYLTGYQPQGEIITKNKNKISFLSSTSRFSPMSCDSGDTHTRVWVCIYIYVYYVYVCMQI